MTIRQYVPRIIILLIVAVSLHLLKNRNQTEPASQSTVFGVPTPSPMPFAEITIPNLASYEYDSSMGEMTKIDGNTAYERFLTSYTSDGFRVNALLTKPVGNMPNDGYPAIIFIHGYVPPTQYRTTEKYVDYVDYLARNGFVVFKIDLRGHGESEGEASGAYFASEYIRDTLNAHTALQKVEYVNPEKIGLWGHSMAGNIVARTLAARPQIKTGVVWAGAVYTYQDMLDYGISDGSYRPPALISDRQRRRQLLFDTYGRYSPESEFWQQVSPINYLKNNEISLQIHHAIDDDVVSIEYSRNVDMLLKNSKATVELFEYPSGGHNISGSSFVQAMQRTVTFFNESL